MKRYTFGQLVIGKVYYRVDPLQILMFIGMRNNQIAEFLHCKYDEDADDWYPADKFAYLTKDQLIFY